MSKSWLLSRTLWVNVGMAALAAAEVNFQMLRPLLGESTYGVMLFSLTIANVILRFVTTSPITLSIQSGSGDGKPPKKDP